MLVCIVCSDIRIISFKITLVPGSQITRAFTNLHPFRQIFPKIKVNRTRLSPSFDKKALNRITLCPTGNGYLQYFFTLAPWSVVKCLNFLQLQLPIYIRELKHINLWLFKFSAIIVVNVNVSYTFPLLKLSDSISFITNMIGDIFASLKKIQWVRLCCERQYYIFTKDIQGLYHLINSNC